MMYLHTIGESTRYNGWTNWHTFSVGSNLMNDEGLYLMACDYQRSADKATWIGFVESAGLEDIMIGGVSFDDPNLDHTELTELIQEINA